jgi:integrase
MTPTPAGCSTTVLTARGEKTVTARFAAALPIPSGCRHPERIAPFVLAASVLLMSMPSTSSSKIECGLRLFRSALNFWGILDADVTATVVLCFIILRCARPIGAAVPADPEFTRRVVPQTAAADISAIHRAIALGVAGTASYAAAFGAPMVNMLLRAIGARAKRMSTNKRPLLFKEVESYVEKNLKDKRPEGRGLRVRDCFAIVMAFVFGLRLSELLNLNNEDVTVGPNDEIIIELLQTKTNRSLFGTHEAFRCASRHPLLLRVFDAFNKEVGFAKTAKRPLFYRMVGRTADRLGRAWFQKVVSTAAPDATPHSCRVGMATELHAARVPLHLIMVAGRWRSTAALLYILSNIDDSIEATSHLGKAKLRKEGVDLRRDVEKEAVQWMPVVAAGDPNDED